MGLRSVIGTTDTRIDTPYSEVDGEDRAFLLAQINARLDLPEPLTVDDVIAERCGVRPLVVTADGGDTSDVDWTSLSRKHEIEVDRRRRAVTVFGGKLTDCLNVGEEVADAVESLGLVLEPDLGNWYGEPAAQTRAEFHRQARLMRLDDRRDRPGVEPLSDRLWRRYGRRAFAMLEAVRADPTMADDVLGGTDYLRVELHLAASTEMVTRLEDFMRRRSKIELVVPAEDYLFADGLDEVAEILFGDAASAKVEEYRASHPASGRTG
jgi:glycerol-3-phosphate dehydrogenase